MSRFNLRKFTSPDQLGTVSGPRLIVFLQPWSTYLAARGFDLPDANTMPFDYAKLGGILMSPDTTTPADMIDALYYVSEVSALENVEDLQAKITSMGIPVDRDPLATALDYVIDVWGVSPELIRLHHAEALARAQQTFDYFSGADGLPQKFPAMSEPTRLAIEAALDDWFEEHRRGRGCRLIVIRQPGTVWFIVRHGNLMRRESSHKDDGTAGTEFYRPQLHDVIVYDEKTNEIGVHASGKRSTRLYLQTLGRYFFDNSEYFQSTPRYTLAPLIDLGVAALACDDISGLEHVTLVETQVNWGGRFKEAEIRRANDIFAAAEQRGLEQIARREPVMAAFKVKFADSPRERRLVIRTPASARYERNEDCEIVEAWLRARGFLLSRQDDREGGDASIARVLAGA